MTVPMIRCKRWLAALWFGGAGILFFILFLQTAFGHYGGKASDAWSWLLPSLMPTLSLMIGVLVADAMGKPALAEADAFFFKLTFAISSSYLGALLLLFLLQPISSVTPFDMMTQSNLWLGPFQGLVAAAMGAFFVKPAGSGRAVKR